MLFAVEVACLVLVAWFIGRDIVHIIVSARRCRKYWASIAEEEERVRTENAKRLEGIKNALPHKEG